MVDADLVVAREVNHRGVADVARHALGHPVHKRGVYAGSGAAFQRARQLVALADKRCEQLGGTGERAVDVAACALGVPCLQALDERIDGVLERGVERCLDRKSVV